MVFFLPFFACELSEGFTAVLVGSDGYPSKSTRMSSRSTWQSLHSAGTLIGDIVRVIWRSSDGTVAGVGGGVISRQASNSSLWESSSQGNYVKDWGSLLWEEGM